MLHILHTNDLHGCLTEEKAAILSERKSDETLVADSGDCIKAGNLSVPIRPDQVWGLLADAGCCVGTIGNRETHILAKAFKAKLRGHAHELVCANLYDKNGDPVLNGAAEFDFANLSVGVIGLMVPMVTQRMPAYSTSAYWWMDPLDAVHEALGLLRPSVDLIVACTHIGYAQDVRLAELGLPIDIILGGHSHTVLERPEKVGNTWICQGGSHANWFGEYWWDPASRQLTGGLVAW